MHFVVTGDCSALAKIFRRVLGRIEPFCLASGMRLFPALAGATLVITVVAACHRDKLAEPIKLGEFAAMTGREAVFGQSSHQGALLAIEELQAKLAAAGRRMGEPR